MTYYHTKYLKYKSKYLKLKTYLEKSQSGGDDLYITELKKLYPECVFDRGSIKDAAKYENSGYKTIYGEMDYAAIEKFNEKFNSTGNIKYFIDFGSGRGKLPLFMGDKVNKSVGIELVTERYNDAIILKENLSKKFSEITNKVELINGDMFDYLKSVNKTTFSGPVLIWISNLCFSEHITKKLFDELIVKMPTGSIIGSSKIPNEISSGIEPIILAGNTDDKLIVPMSWSKQSAIYLYKIK